MHRNLKAALLSAFILPGLGQLYKKERLKGAVLVMLVNIFILVALYFVAQGMGQLAVGISQPTQYDPQQLAASLSERSPVVRKMLVAFCAVWAYGVVDALLTRKPSSS